MTKNYPLIHAAILIAVALLIYHWFVNIQGGSNVNTGLNYGDEGAY